MSCWGGSSSACGIDEGRDLTERGARVESGAIALCERLRITTAHPDVSGNYRHRMELTARLQGMPGPALPHTDAGTSVSGSPTLGEPAPGR